LPRHGRALAQVAAVDELHRVVRTCFTDGIVVHFDDVRVRELRERRELLLEQAHRLLIVPIVSRQRELLQGDLAPVCEIHCSMDLRHTAAAEELADRVTAVHRLELGRRPRLDLRLAGHFVPLIA
jgi:hypothetical protein